jgi:hypothetical protein
MTTHSKTIVIALVAMNMGLARPAFACIWDADTSKTKRRRTRRLPKPFSHRRGRRSIRLGVVALVHADQNLAIAAVDRAPALGPANADRLHDRADFLRRYVAKSIESEQGPRRAVITMVSALVALTLALALLAFLLVRRSRARKQAAGEAA